MSRLSAELVALSVKPPDPFGELVPQPFDPSRTEYTWALPESVHSVVITASLPPGATLTIDDVNWPAAGMSWDLPISTNQVVLRVRSESGRTKDYTLTVNRTDSAKTITEFKIDNLPGTIDETSRTITATLPANSFLDGKNVQIRHTGKSVTLLDLNGVLKSVETAQPAVFPSVNFSGESREFIITAIDDSTQTYTVTVSAATGNAAKPAGNPTVITAACPPINVSFSIGGSGDPKGRSEGAPIKAREPASVLPRNKRHGVPPNKCFILHRG